MQSNVVTENTDLCHGNNTSDYFDHCINVPFELNSKISNRILKFRWLYLGDYLFFLQYKRG